MTFINPAQKDTITIPVKHQTVTFESFGAKGNGADETQQILRALNKAKEMHLPIEFLNKTYIFSPSSTVDITGIPAFTGKGRLNLSKTGANAGNKGMKAVFQVTGKKEILSRSLSNLQKGQSSVSLLPGLSIRSGDILFLVSPEALPNSKRPYYCKGERLTVKSYNSLSGMLTLTSKLRYGYGSACLWTNSFRPQFHVDPQIGFVTSYMNFITCFRVYYATANFSGYYENFALTAIMYKSADGTVENMVAKLPVNANNGYSHCIEVADMSDVLIRNCTLEGGRHVVSGTAGGLWEKEECGGAGHAGYPSNLTIDGGTYTGSINNEAITADIGTLDAHGVVATMQIKNCIIHGGINLGAEEMHLQNLTIYPHDKHAFNVGSDVQEGSEWGSYFIENTTIRLDENSPPVFKSKSDSRLLVIDKLSMQNFNDKNVLMDFNFYAPWTVKLSNLRGVDPRKTPVIYTLKRTKFTFSNTNLGKEAVKLK